MSHAARVGLFFSSGGMIYLTHRVMDELRHK